MLHQARKFYHNPQPIHNQIQPNANSLFHLHNRQNNHINYHVCIIMCMNIAGEDQKDHTGQSA